MAIALAAGSLVAQDEGGRGRRGGRGFGGGFGGGGMFGGELGLLNIEQVQKEIELVDDQKEQVRKLNEEQQTAFRDAFAGFRDLSEEERRKRGEELRGKMEAQQKEVRAKLDEILLPHQSERLKQISIQVRGSGALADPTVAEELGLTADQKEKLQQVNEEMDTRRREAFQGGNREGGRERFEAMRKEAEEKTLAVLTAEQKTKFEQMKGEAFELDRSQLFGRGGPGGPGGPGGGRGRGDGDRN
jgi:hypothetical protein